MTGKAVDGEPAVWIWLEFDDDNGEFEISQTEVGDLSLLILDCLQNQQISQWPFVRFRTRTELSHAY